MTLSMHDGLIAVGQLLAQSANRNRAFLATVWTSGRAAGIRQMENSLRLHEVEAVLRSEPLDFLQINYAMEDRAAGERLLPLAAERGVAVLVNMPFGGGRLSKRLQGKPLPAWAGEIGCTTWPQVLPKFVLAHPAVTCVIPGSGDAGHMAQNAVAGMGVLPAMDYWENKDL